MSNLTPKYRAALTPIWDALMVMAKAGPKVPLTTEQNLQVRDLIAKADLAFDVPAHTDDDVSAAIANAMDAEGRAECYEHLEAAEEGLRRGIARLNPPIGWMWAHCTESYERDEGGLFRTMDEAKVSYESFLREVYDDEEQKLTVEWKTADVKVYDAIYESVVGEIKINGEIDDDMAVEIKPVTWAPY